MTSAGVGLGPGGQRVSLKNVIMLLKNSNQVLFLANIRDFFLMFQKKKKKKKDDIFANLETYSQIPLAKQKASLHIFFLFI